MEKKIFTHMSEVSYKERQDFKVSQHGDNRYALEITQGGNLIWITTHSVYGGYYQGNWDTQLNCGSVRRARKLFNQMQALGDVDAIHNYLSCMKGSYEQVPTR